MLTGPQKPVFTYHCYNGRKPLLNTGQSDCWQQSRERYTLYQRYYTEDPCIVFDCTFTSGILSLRLPVEWKSWWFVCVYSNRRTVLLCRLYLKKHTAWPPGKQNYLCEQHLRVFSPVIFPSPQPASASECYLSKKPNIPFLPLSYITDRIIWAMRVSHSRIRQSAFWIRKLSRGRRSELTLWIAYLEHMLPNSLSEIDSNNMRLECFLQAMVPGTE